MGLVCKLIYSLRMKMRLFYLVIGLIFVAAGLRAQPETPAGLVLGQDLPNRDRTWYFCPEGDVQMIEDVWPEKSTYQGKWSLRNGVLSISLTSHYGKRGIGEAWVKENTRGFNEYADFVHVVKETLSFEWDQLFAGDTPFVIVKRDFTCPAGFYAPRLPGKYPIASYKVLSEKELKGMSLEELAIMRTEIMARYGLKFMTSSIYEYYLEKEWYFPDKSSVDMYLTIIEKQNIRKIAAMERRLKR